ncbi:ABC transporter transmembrane domain-containing protein, partial [Salmonella enterica]|uniref:ABC transporter transmembrane domain-containing protein n=1 Tax=Salmonella enterica TaxID=28901 RepID=UPI003CF71935
GDFSGLLTVIFKMAATFGIGIVAMLLQGLLMARVGQGVQRSIRNEMFAHMQRLPVSYFDRHPFGDIMSHYTNDIDTLAQMLSQSI